MAVLRSIGDSPWLKWGSRRVTPAGEVSTHCLRSSRADVARAALCHVHPIAAGDLNSRSCAALTSALALFATLLKRAGDPQFMKLCPSNTLRSAALSVGQGSSLRVGNDPESGADESRRPECLPWWCLCRDIAQPCRGNPESPTRLLLTRGHRASLRIA